MKREKGITLIALIITIIVMLILVGVTINVALNGGIFDKAKDATQKTSREVSREEIVAAMIGAYDNNGNFVKANVELPEGVKWCTKNENYSNASGEGNYVVTKNDEKFYVSPTDGTVLDEEPQTKPAEVDDLIPTDAEKALADYNSAAGIYTYLSGDNGMLYYVERDSKRGIQIVVGLESYMYASEGDFGSLMGIENMQLNNWYKCIYDEEVTTSIYNGPCPIEFTEEQLQNNSYLKRIHDSFNNEN